MICHLKTIAALLNLRQQDIAEAVGVSRNSVTEWSRNKAIPNLDAAYRVVNFLNQQAENKGINKRWSVEQIWEQST